MPAEKHNPYFIYGLEGVSTHDGMLVRGHRPPSVIAKFPPVRVESGAKMPLVRVYAHTALDRWALWVDEIRTDDGAGALEVEVRLSPQGGGFSTIVQTFAKGIANFFDNPILTVPITGTAALVATIWGTVDVGTATASFILTGGRSSCCSEEEPT